MYRQLALMGITFGCCASALAGEPAGAIAPAHGPVLMLYFSRAIGSHTTPVFGLRLDRASVLSSSDSAPGIAVSSSPRRSLIDVQLSDIQPQRSADLRVEFGQRLTWDLRRREFSLPNSRQPQAVRFVARSSP